MFSSSLRQGITTLTRNSSVSVGACGCAGAARLCSCVRAARGSARCRNAMPGRKLRRSRGVEDSRVTVGSGLHRDGACRGARAAPRGACARLHARARLPGLRLPVPVDRRRRGALVPQPRRAPGGRGPRGHLPDAAAVGRGAIRPRSRACGSSRSRAATSSTARTATGASRRRCASAGACCATCCAAGATTTSCTSARSPTSRCSAAALARPRGRLRLVVDWFEIWSRAYWVGYLGGVGGRIGYAIQRLCVRVPQRAQCFSRLHEARLLEEGLRGEHVLLGGLYDGRGEPRRRRCSAAGERRRGCGSSCSPAATSPRSARPRRSRRSRARAPAGSTCAASSSATGPSARWCSRRSSATR